MNKEVKMSSKHQIVIPKEAREYIDLEPGDKLVVEGVDDKIVLWKPPTNYTSHLAGLHKKLWKGLSVDRYMAGLRKEWGQRKDVKG